MTDEQLLAAVNATANTAPAEPEIQVEEETAEPEAEVSEPEAKPETETVQAEPEKEEDATQLLIEQMRLERERDRSEYAERIKALERKLGQQAGRAGYLEKKLKQSEHQDDFSSTQEEAEPQSYQEPARRIGTVAARNAMVHGIGMFRATNPDSFTNGTADEELDRRFTEAGQRDQVLLSAQDEDEIAERTQALLSRIWTDIRLERLKTRTEKAKERTLKQSEGLRNKKLASAASSSGGGAVREQKKAKTPAELPDAELKRLVDRTAQMLTR